jgi:hypothetical protein
MSEETIRLQAMEPSGHDATLTGLIRRPFDYINLFDEELKNRQDYPLRSYEVLRRAEKKEAI